MSHTRGPWHVTGTGRDVADAEGHMVAAAWRDNAPLIAAAPDLLAALVPFSECEGVPPDYTGTCLDAGYDVVCDGCRATAAVAKATGAEVEA